MIGTCTVVEDPLYVSLKLDDFNMQVILPDLCNFIPLIRLMFRMLSSLYP